MKILALESSATAASVAICQDEALIAQTFQHTGLTHSQTLLPMVQQILAACQLSLSDIDLIAVAAGPGSFTGLRIGVSAAKGLAWAWDIPCTACSTLESMAWNAVGHRGEICAAMDARRSQVYNARFLSNGETITRITEDRAISLADLAAELAEQSPENGTEKLVVGDGALLCYNELKNQGISLQLAPPNLRMQSVFGVARLGLELSRRGEAISGGSLVPTYLRLSQAERERQERENQET